MKASEDSRALERVSSSEQWEQESDVVEDQISPSPYKTKALQKQCFCFVLKYSLSEINIGEQKIYIFTDYYA